MVFSETSRKPRSVLKVVELDRLKSGKDQLDLPGGSTTTAAMAAPPPPEPTPSSSFSEVYLKSELELEESTMYRRSADYEFFQDLDSWCSAHAKEEPVQTIDTIKPTEENVINTDTFNTLYQPPDWDSFDVSSPTAPASFYTCGTPHTLSPTVDTPVRLGTKFTYQDFDNKDKFHEGFMDISSLPVVIGNFTEPWLNTDTQHTQILPFIDQDDSLDAKLVAVGPGELQWGGGAGARGAGGQLRLDVAAPAAPPALSTPEVLQYVEQLETLDSPASTSQHQWPQDATRISLESPTSSQYSAAPPAAESDAEFDAAHSSRRRRRRSDSSDDYTPYEPKKTRKYKRRKPSLPIKDMIQALEEAQPQTKARRGRPPKRRDSTVSSICSTDTYTGSSGKYREIRDKNNEASKRSRMNRKLKELQMEQLAIELEERNKKLQVKADILEDMTKRLKDALMSAILKP